MKRTSLLKYLKIELDTDLKIILLECQNNYVGLEQCCKKFWHFSNRFWASYIIIFLV